ncbi:MAG TPA: TadG family pilus assembly protein [Polyangia bacterium]|nr:TadG family pilus assembly protein [Polyangia bacterium]
MVNLRATGSLSSARSTAVRIAAANTVLNKPLVLRDANVTFGGWDFVGHSFVANTVPANAVMVSGGSVDPTAAAGNVSLAFGRVLGFSQASVTRSSVAAYRVRNIVMELDVTGSFLYNSFAFNGVSCRSDSDCTQPYYSCNGGTCGYPSCSSSGCPIDNAVKATVAMLDALYQLGIPSDQVGLDVFISKSWAVSPLQNLRNNYSGIRVQWNGDGLSSLNVNKKSGLAICSKANADPKWLAIVNWPNHPWMPFCNGLNENENGDAGFYGGTDQGAGIERAIGSLTNQQFQNDGTRAIVLLTDGGPACCSNAQGSNCADGLACNDGSALCNCARHAAQHGRDMADLAASNNISIFTVLFGASPAGIAYGASLVRGFGQPYNTPDSTQLQSILLNIANQIPVSIVR